MHHGGGPPSAQLPLQRSRSFTGSSEGEEQQPHSGLPQSPATAFAPSASPSAPQSPGYQIQQLMSRSPVAGQNVNITLQNVGPVVGGSQQITLAPLPLPSPTSPSFQFSAQQRRFEHGSPSYIQVTSPLSQQVQTQSPTQPSPGPGQALPSLRAGTSAPGLGLCSSSPTGGFVDASVLVRQISLSPSSGGHFVFQEGAGLGQLAQGAQVQLQHTGTPMAMRERRLSQPHAQSGGTIHHLGPQSPAAGGGSMQPLASPGHLATASLPPQLSSLIQGQLMQQQVLQGQQLSRPLGFERTPQGVLLPGVGGSSAFGMTSPPPPTSPSRTSVPTGLSSLPLTSAVGMGVRKAPRKLEEIPPASPEMAQMRKQCLDYHYREMDALKETFKEYLIELFFLQHLQGNMMDFLAFRKKHYAPLQAYLRQNDLDVEEEEEDEEDEEEEKSEVINDEVKVVTGKDGQTGTPVAIATQLPPKVSAAFSSQQQPLQQALAGTLVATGSGIEVDPFQRQPVLPPQAEQSKRPRLDVGHQGVVFQHPGVSPGVPLQQLMPTAQGGMPPTPQAAQLTGQKQSQQQYDPSTGPPVQNAASLHTPPPQLPARLPPAGAPAAAPPATLQFSQQPPVMESQTQLQIPTKPQQPAGPMPVPPSSQFPAPLQQPAQPTLHVPLPGKAHMQVSQLPTQPQTVALTRPPMEVAQTCQRPLPTSSTSSLTPVGGSGPGPSPARASPVNRPSSATNKSLSPVTSRSPGTAVPIPPKAQSPAQNATLSQDSTQEKLAEQITLENRVQQRVSELRKEGLWSPRRLPKLQEAPRPRAHWDSLLEEMQWMATDFAQERRWKVAAAKKLVRTVARHHEERQLREERGKKEEQDRLRRIAASTAREIEYFWSNMEQVVEIKLQVELEEKRKKALNIPRVSRRGKEPRLLGLDTYPERFLDSGMSGRKRKASTSLTDDEVEDEEETIEEEEANEGMVDHQMELSNLAKEAELPLIDLMKLYEGAFLPNFQWPQPQPDSEETSEEEDMEDSPSDRDSRKDLVLIDSLFIMDQFKAAERMSIGKPNTKDIAEVTAVAEAILPKGSARVVTSVKFNTPSLLYGALRDYQKIGLDWLAKLYRKRLNGVLADEAGLGKTVQVIAFFAHLACNEGNWGPHLVVVRSCNILKWELELKRWCPGLKTLLYVGSHRELRAKRQEWTEPHGFNICITSYKRFFKGYHSFAKVRWRCLVIDEMQQVKNMTDRHWGAVFNLHSQQRLLLIDSPLHNTFLELWTMVHFLIPGISRPYLSFPLKAPNEENQDYYHKLVIRLHRVTQPFILRRTKRDVEKQLTKKYEHVLKCRLSSRQKALYEDVILQPGTQEALKSGHFVNVLNILVKLQRICNHPGLVEPRLPRSSYVASCLEFWAASLLLKALERGFWKEADLSVFDLVGLENKITRHDAELLSKKKITRKLIEDIFTSPPSSARPVAVKLKPSRLFQPVQYGQKPEGRTVAFPSTHPPRTATPAAAPTTAPQGQVRGRPPIATFSANPDAKAAAAQCQPPPASSSAPRQQPTATFTSAASAAHPASLRGPTTAPAPAPGPPPPPAPAPGHTTPQSALPPRLVLTAQAQARLPSGEVVKIAQLASIAGTQNRVAQPETPVTLQFQGNKFTLSHNQLRQLTAGQPLQLQGSVLQIVSAPGQPYLRPPGPVVMQTMSQAGTVHGAINALGGKPPVGAAAPTPLAPQVGVPGRVAINPLTSGDPGMVPKPASPLGAPTQEERARLLKERLDQIFLVNERRCSRMPVYGRDLLGACSLATRNGVPLFGKCPVSPGSKSDLILMLSQHTESLRDVSDRVACVIPTVVAAPPSLRVARPPSSYSHRMKLFRHRLREHLAPHVQQLRQATAPRLLQFPELRLVQFDSGKLEALAILLQKLKSEGRRVLILSQMVLMLDILEMFLNFHYLTYVRIDENANGEQRQELMRSFNRDRRIFCAILSSHSRSTGVNLVEADTVVFYDNDLNPVMDAKAQEWCDRIGRCKDIHIYRLCLGTSADLEVCASSSEERLVSGNSVEEKLLKNGTKDLIREVAAQGNDYSMAFLTQRTIQELFEVSSPMEDTGFPVKAEEFVVLSQEPSATEAIAPKIARPFIEALKSIEYLEEDALRPSEDVAGARADISPAEGVHLGLEEEPSQWEELADFMEQLTPIEKYALNYLELFHTSMELGRERASEDVALASMKEWETQNMRALREWAAREEAPQEELLTYTRGDAYNMEYICEDADGQTETMPLWTPPTPPQDDNDIYIDSVMCLMYEATPIPESKLPPVYVRKERKRHKTDPSGRKKKQRHGEAVVPPRSLFDRATPGLLKMRREGKEQKKNLLLKQQTQFAKPLPTFAKPATESGQDSPEWLISEDWALLQAVKQLLELPLNLTVVSPAHTPNWDLVSDVVNACSRIYRSSKQCRNRYENVIIPREEGKSKNNRPLRTSQIYAQDENATHTQLYTNHFDLMKMTAGKRSPPIKPLLGMNPFQKNPKHASVLAESGINYDKPLPPIQVASLRAERIAKEKKALADQQKAQQPAVAQPAQPPPPPPQPQQPPPPLPQPQPVTSQQPTGQPAVPAQAQAQPQPQPQTVQPQPKAQPAITSGSSAAVLAGTIKTSVTGTSIPAGPVSGNVIVNTIAGVPAATFQSINKRLSSPVASGALPTTGGSTPAQVVHTQPRAVGSPATATTELVSMATTQGVRAVTSVTAPAVVTTNLTPVQAPARSLVTQVSQAAGVQLPGKTITPAHFQLLRQQQQQQPPSQVQVPQIQGQAPSPAQIKAVGKLTPEHLIKMQKQKLQLPQQAPPQAQPGPPTPTPPVQAQPQQPPQQQSAQLTTVTAPRPGALLTGTTVANLQVARLTRVPTSQLQAQGQMQAQTPPTAQVALAKPPVVSVPAAVVSSPGVTTLPMNVAGISVAIGQPQKAAGQTVVAQPVHVQQLLKLKQQAVQQQKAIQPQGAQGPAAVQQKITAQQIAQGQQQKVTYAPQPALKTQFLTTPISQAPKLAGTQQVQTQIQVAKLPQVVQQQTTVASIQQVATASQQASPQTVTLTQATTAGQQVQMIPAVTATAQVVQQKLIQQQVVTTASTQLQSPGIPNPAQGPTSCESPNQQPKLQMRVPAVRLKTPTKPPCQ